MRSTEFIRQLLDIMDQVDAAQAPAEIQAVQVDIEVDTDSTQEPEYTNSPAEVVVPTGTVLSGGTDLQSPKNPADLRAANSFSMFPAWLAKGE